MERRRFWELIDAARTRDEADECERLRAVLEPLSSEELIGFERCFIGAMDLAYHADLWRAGYLIEHDLDEAGFFGFRAWLVAQGRASYQAVLADPEHIVALLGEHAWPLPSLPEFRAVVQQLYAEREGEPIPGRERGSAPSELAGEMDEWDEFLARSPRLAAAYWSEGEVGRLWRRNQRIGRQRPVTERLWAGTRVFMQLGAPLLAILASLIWAPWWLSIVSIPCLAVGFRLLLRRARRKWVRDYFSRARGVGTATFLRGEVGYAVVHFGPHGDDEPIVAPPALAEALALLEAEAARYGVDLRFANRTPAPRVPAGPPLEPDDPGVHLPVPQRVQAAVLADPDLAELAGREPNFFVVAVTHHQLRACAYPRTHALGPGLELCVVSHDDDADAFAHEILHLFGARDLYLEDGWAERQDSSTRTVMRELERVFPAAALDRAIMRCKGREVDPANAFAVGWTERWG